MADPMTIGMIGMGSNALGGIFGAVGAQNKAKGDQIAIQGQMLQTMGQAYQMDVQAAEYGTRANMSDYQAGVAKVNQKIAEQQSDYARAVGEVEAETAGLKSRAELGRARAAQGASGIDVSSGSSVNVRQSMIELGYHDQNMTRSNAAKVAWGYDIEAEQAEAQGSLYTMTAGLERMQAAAATTGAAMTRGALPLQQQAMGVAGTAGTIGTFASLANAAGSVSSKWLAGKSEGLWG
jgi:hypothetical protein